MTHIFSFKKEFRVTVLVLLILFMTGCVSPLHR